jgi:4-amino-4-deoxy-L-arabinose transferase-like glycosyltransferase
MTSSRSFKDLGKYVENFLRSAAFILMLILSLALFLRIYRLEQVPAGLYYDEISAVYTPYLYKLGIVVLSLRNVIAYLLSGTFFTYSLFGPSVFLTRLPEVMLGTLLVFAVYLLAKEMFSKSVGLLSAVLVAVSPWALPFSRFQAFCSAYVLFFTVAMLFLYKGINVDDEKKKFAWFCLGSLMLGLTADILASSRVFIPLFILGFLIAYSRMKPLRTGPLLTRGLVCATIFLIAYSPVFLDYYVYDPTVSRAFAYSISSHSQYILDLLKMGLERAYMHLSPGFLVFTAPATHDLPFQETISQSELSRLSPTLFGQLNYYGVLLYPGILLLAYEGIKKRSKQHVVLLWWIVCYLIVSGIAYYDNPNPARNIVGLPALVITISLFIGFLLKIVPARQFKIIPQFHFNHLVVTLLICLVAVPTSLFLYEYYVTYPGKSAKVFDYGYKEAANYLSANGIWGRDIYIHDKSGRDLTLSFYSPEQPPPGKITTIFNIMDLDPKKSFIQVSKEIAFEHGIIECETRIERGYSAATSPHIRLIWDENNTLEFSIYANDSTYTPNWYLLLQKVNNTRYFEQRPLGEIIEYGKWYSVRLTVNSTAVSFTLDGGLITSWSRPVDGAYKSLILASESATVSFKNLIIHQNSESLNLFEAISLSDWEIISGKLEITEYPDDHGVTLLPRGSNAILVTHYQEDSVILSEIPHEFLKNIYYPDGTLAFSIFELTP